MTVYIVTHEGDYSEYVEAVFQSREQAVAYIETHIGHSWASLRIEEYEMDESAPKTDKQMWDVTFMNGRWFAEPTDEATLGKPILRVIEPWLDGKVHTFRANIFAKDKEHALKIASDEFARLKAEREGVAI